ncbi:MAG: right-handed parallel beta-helix repeat-containing protein [Candidatus Hodarchaeota archaeon]
MNFKKDRKRKRRTIIELVVFVICLLFVGFLKLHDPINSREKNRNICLEDKFLLKLSNLTVHAPIIINNNSELELFVAGNGTNGTAGNPHVISNYYINCNNSSQGIFIQNTDLHLTIENCRISNASFKLGDTVDSGIQLINVSNVLFKNNTFDYNYNGVSFYNSTNITLIENKFHYNYLGGLMIANSGNNTLRNNSFLDCGFGLIGSFEEVASQDIDLSNRMNGGYLYYLKDQVGHLNITFETGSELILVNCSDLIIRDLHFTNTSAGIVLLYSSNISILSNNFTETNLYGIYLFESNNTSIIDNYISRTGYSLVINKCNDTSIISNTIIDNFIDAIVVSECIDVNIDLNILKNNTAFGVKVVVSNNIMITNNDVSDSRFGISIMLDANKSVVKKNLVEKCYYALHFLSKVNELNITQNNLINNSWGLHIVDIQNALISLNNFINNTIHQAEIIGATNVSCSNNGWGNYWSDYSLLYPNATNFPNGTWDIPYKINNSTNLSDPFPLINENSIPLVDFHVDSIQVTKGVRIQFLFNGTRGDLPLDIFWDFDDSSYDLENLNPFHVFNTAGTYNVSLKIWDAHGEFSEKYLLIIVQNPSLDERDIIAITITISSVIGIVVISTILKRRKSRKNIDYS